MIDYRDRSLYSSSGYLKAKNYYLVVKAPYQVPSKELFNDFVEATEDEYEDYQHFLRIKAKTKRESILINKENNND